MAFVSPFCFTHSCLVFVAFIYFWFTPLGLPSVKSGPNLVFIEKGNYKTVRELVKELET